MADRTQWLLENAKKECLNVSVKPEWLCLRHRQAWSRPQSPVKWESVESGDWTGLNASVKLLSRAYLQRMWEAWHCWGGGQNQPVCTSTVLREPVSSTTSRPAERTYSRNQPLIFHLFIIYQWIILELFIVASKSASTLQEGKSRENICHVSFNRILYYDLTGCPFYVLYHWTFNANIFAIKCWKRRSGQTHYLTKRTSRKRIERIFSTNNDFESLWKSQFGCNFKLTGWRNQISKYALLSSVQLRWLHSCFVTVLGNKYLLKTLR